MKCALRHRRFRCEKRNDTVYTADDYEIVSQNTGEVLGSCELRRAPIEVLPYSGNVSYTVFERFRGRGVAKAALRLLCEIAADEMRELWITVDSNNAPSIGVCRAVGAVFVDEISVGHLVEFQNRGIETIKRFKIYL